MNQVLADILKQYKTIWALNNAKKLLSWDLETYMPEKGAKYRGETLSMLSLLVQKSYLALNQHVMKVDKLENLSDVEKGIVRVLNRRLHFYKSVPPELLKQLDTITTEATVVWRQAKKHSDFSKFAPYLSKIIELNIQLAEKLGYEKHPYNALLDLYEEKFTVSDADAMFSKLLPESKDILNKIINAGIFTKRLLLETQHYSVAQMRKVNQKIIELLEMPRDRFRVDVSPHPFTIGLSINDVRITTRYEEYNFKSSLYSVIHESGHALYNLQIDPVLSMTPIATGASSGFHESQSRFWENIIGKSIEFVRLIYPILKEHLNVVHNYTLEDIYTYFNTVKPSEIRVDADEVTYNLHIALRYELEKKLIAQELDPVDVPAVWNEFMDKYLGITPRSDAEGVLQDIHWSGGAFGYFPTYTLGNIIAAMIWEHMPQLKEDIEVQAFNHIKEFLYDKICRFGATYEPKKLLEKSFGDTYNSESLIKYIKKKYL